MKPFLALLAVPMLPLAARAQTITGRVANEGGAPLSAATVSLLSATDSSWLRSELTDRDGRYIISYEAGSYLIQAQAEGRAPRTAPCTIPASGEATIDFALPAPAVGLEAVTVSARRPTIQAKPGMMVVNVEGSAVSAGSNVLEILRRSPGVQVDAQGRISLRGKPDVQVYVDGRPVRMSGQQLVAYLTSMTAEELAQIELITQPSAKYDAAGTAGVINIRTRAVRKRGLAVNLNGTLTQATYGQGNAAARVTYRNGPWTLYAGEYFNYVDMYNTLRVDRRFTDPATGASSGAVLTDQVIRFNSRFHRIKAGGEYALNPRTTVGLRVQMPAGTPVALHNNFTAISGPAGAAPTYTAGTRLMTNYWDEKEVGFLGRHQLKNSGEVSVDGFYVSNRSGDEGIFTNTPTDAARRAVGPSEQWFMKFPVGIRMLSVRADYSASLGKATKLEAGAKFVDVHVDNIADFRTEDAAGAFVPDGMRSTRFLFRETVPALYASLQRSLGSRVEVQAGLRAEQTVSNGRVSPTGEAFQRSYISLFPTLFASYAADSLHSFTLSYGRRLDRPQYYQLNPARNYIDKYSYRVGNPLLRPQFVNNIEVAHAYKGQLTTTLSYMQADGIISDFFVQDDATKTAYEIHDNIAGYGRAGIAVNYNRALTDWWTTNLYADFYVLRFAGNYFGTNYVRRGTATTFNTSNQFTFGSGWSGELTGWVNGPALNTVFTQSGTYGSLDVAVAKKLFSDSLTLRLAFDDVLATQRYRGSNVFANFDTDVETTWDARRAVFSAAYSFGQRIETIRRKGEGEGRRM